MSRDEVLETLRVAARLRWGEERAAALAPTIETAAEAISLVLSQPLDLTDEEPDPVLRLEEP